MRKPTHGTSIASAGTLVMLLHTLYTAAIVALMATTVHAAPVPDDSSSSDSSSSDSESKCLAIYAVCILY